jgi:hypothetical protein
MGRLVSRIKERSRATRKRMLLPEFEAFRSLKL